VSCDGLQHFQDTRKPGSTASGRLFSRTGTGVFVPGAALSRRPAPCIGCLLGRPLCPLPFIQPAAVAAQSFLRHCDAAVIVLAANGRQRHRPDATRAATAAAPLLPAGMNRPSADLATGVLCGTMARGTGPAQCRQHSRAPALRSRCRLLPYFTNGRSLSCVPPVQQGRPVQPAPQVLLRQPVFPAILSADPDQSRPHFFQPEPCNALR